ncbi:hypothetical protein PR048_012645 [Dryococelus australis]|uniref:Reverse transcriptase domain-containing protein n=1 Tax=Dryococelus australis TaxID=614101 RepID=A0ABQ9HQP8_9NEOP|nr:hypothetical protein PR048_012645 [Dryococelus australis]
MVLILRSPNRLWLQTSGRFPLRLLFCDIFTRYWLPIQNGIKIKPEQRVFIEKDGLAENITLLTEVLHASTSRGKPLYATVLDIQKAFDTVSHAPLMEVLKARRLPHNILRHIWQLYLMSKTTIQLPGKICQGVPVKQGVRQGDPLSPILFNIVMDEPEGTGGLRRIRVGRRGWSFLTPLGVDAKFKYLGIQFTRGAVKAFKQDLEGPLEWISSAPLKPYQRMELLKVFLLPSLIYRLSFAKVTMGALKACDVINRTAVCRWLRLPHDTALGFFHAACSAGGLGIPSLVRSVPVWILGRLRNVLKTNYPPTRELKNQQLFSRRVEWARANYWRAQWSGSVDGADLETARSSRESTVWIDQRVSGIPSRDYLSYLHIISNSLPSAVRTSWGRRGPTGALPKCRAGCNDAETMYHVVQQCPRNNETSVVRHNQVLKVVADRLEERGYRVLREPSYRTSDDVRVPDLVVSKPEDDDAHVLEVQVVQSKWMDCQMPRHLISDAHEWINEIPTVPIYYLVKPLPWERAWKFQRGKKTLLSLTLVWHCKET